MMTAILNRIHYVEYNLEEHIRQVVAAHPYLAALLLLIGTPLFIIMAVVVCTITIMAPFGMLFGWI